MIGIIMTMILLVVMFKLTFLLLRLLGKILGTIISVLGYLCIGGFALVLSIPLVFVPIMFIVGIASLIIGCIRA